MMTLGGNPSFVYLVKLDKAFNALFGVLCGVVGKAVRKRAEDLSRRFDAEKEFINGTNAFINVERGLINVNADELKRGGGG